MSLEISSNSLGIISLAIILLVPVHVILGFFFELNGEKSKQVCRSWQLCIKLDFCLCCSVKNAKLFKRCCLLDVHLKWLIRGALNQELERLLLARSKGTCRLKH